jgi:hypothetical protein
VDPRPLVTDPPPHLRRARLTRPVSREPPRPSGLSGGAIGAILWFEIAVFAALFALAPAVLFASALCDAGPECSPGRALLGMLVTGVGVGAAFLIAVAALDAGARRSRLLAVLELLAGGALIAAPVVAAVLPPPGEDASVPLVVSVVFLLVPGIGLLRAGSSAARRAPRRPPDGHRLDGRSHRIERSG